MTWFIFIGDLFVMLFMFCVVTWVFLYSPRKQIDRTARIPLEDEE